jgi:DNA repair exonuclease SbcCD ATPase subunit
MNRRYNRRMGWLELIALMKRILPLLSRLAPLLEGYIGGRGAARGDAEAFENLRGDLKSQREATTQNHADLTSLLNAVDDRLSAQSARLQHHSDELQHLRAADAENQARLENIEQQVAESSRQTAANARLLRIASLLTVFLLLACVGLLIALMRR